ncbi:MAG: hypothetical protein ABIH03_07560 [Pseudomonadota bacterium]
MRRLFLLVAATLAVFLSAGCGTSGSSADPPANVVAVPGDGIVTVTWPMASGVDYWLFYAPSPSISTSNWTAIPGSKAAIGVGSPHVVAGLANGTLYSFVINGRTGGGPGGTGSPSVSAVPRLAGTATATLPAPWTAGAALGANDLRGLVLGSALVAVGAGGVTYSSSDGVNWTAGTSPDTANLNAVAYYNGTYVAVGDGGTVLYSYDAANWAKQTIGATSKLNAIANNSEEFVAVGAGGTIVYSTDGITWGAAANPATTSDLYAVVPYSNGLWIAVGANGTLITSIDGSNWNLIASNTPLDLTAITFGVSTVTNALVFVAMGASGALITSPDAVTWTAQPAVSANSISAVTYATQFIAVGTGGTILTSTDGTTWAAQPSTTSANLYAILRGPSIYGYVAVGVGGVNLLAK